MVKADYEKLPKRIEENISKKSGSANRFELPNVDVHGKVKKQFLEIL